MAMSEMNKKGLQGLKDLGSFLASTAIIPLAVGGLGYIRSKKSIKEELEELKNSYAQSLQMSTKLRDNPDESATRFQELATIAPTVAKNPNMAVKFLEPRLKKGLSIDDVHKLTMIQSHAHTAPYSRSALTEGSAAGALMADKMFTVFGPRMADRLGSLAKARMQDFKDIHPLGGGPSMQKESSQQTVSDSCLGEMMADRYVMFRSAGLYKTATVDAAKVVSEGADAFKAGLKFFAAPLALAGLLHGVGAVVDAHKKKQLDQEANNAFARISKDSEHIRANPLLAAEALDAMKTFAPELAVKPMILKTFIEHTIRTEQLAPQTVNELASAQGNVHKSKGTGFAHGFMSSVDPSIGFGKNILESGKDILHPSKKDSTSSAFRRARDNG